MKKYVIYHANCIDGFGAAFAAWKKFGDNATYIPLNHYDKFPLLEKNSEVYILDFCPESPLLIRELFKSHKKVIILDHHESEYKKIYQTDPQLLSSTWDGSHVVYFQEDLSGVSLAWNYFHPDTPAPDYFSRIQDRDLRNWDFIDTPRITDTLMSLPKTFEGWDKFSLEYLSVSGAVVSQVKNQLIQDICDYNSHFAEIDGYTVPVANASVHWSDVTTELLKRYPEAPFAAAYYFVDAHTMKWSLRSRQSDNLNVADISKQFGGGGHKDSGGFAAGPQDILFIKKEEHVFKKAS